MRSFRFVEVIRRGKLTAVKILRPSIPNAGLEISFLGYQPAILWAEKADQLIRDIVRDEREKAMTEYEARDQGSKP